MLAIRLTRSSAELNSILVRIRDHSSQSIWFQHLDGARTHVHGLIDGLDVSVETLKNWLRSSKDFHTGWDKSDWSFKTSYRNKITRKVTPCDINMITYMSKGHLGPCIQPKGFDDWQKYRQAWIEPKQLQSLKESQHELVEDTKITQREMMEQIEARMALREYSQTALIEEILYVHKIHKKLVSRYKIRDFHDTYEAAHHPQDFIATIKNLINKV